MSNDVNPDAASGDKPVSQGSKKSLSTFQKVIIAFLAFFALQSGIFTIAFLSLLQPQSDVDLVKSMTSSVDTVYTYETLFEVAAEDNTDWEVFESDDGITVVEVSGEVSNDRVQDVMADELSNVLAIEHSEVDDFTFRVQFMRHYPTEIEGFFQNMFPRLSSQSYRYDVGYQAFGAYNDGEEYYDVLNALGDYIAEAY